MDTASPNNENLSEPSGQICQLPNGISVHHINKHETDFLYKEIFVDRVYLKHGIILHQNACVFDVGANIGMFSLFVKQECPACKVYAFEPVPELNHVLRQNLRQYGQDVSVCQAGMSDHEGEATFTYYPDYSIMSGFHADASGDASVLSSGIREQLAKGKSKVKEMPAEIIDSIVEKKLGRKQEFKCKLTTVSTIIREAGVTVH